MKTKNIISSIILLIVCILSSCTFSAKDVKTEVKIDTVTAQMLPNGTFILTTKFRSWKTIVNNDFGDRLIYLKFDSSGISSNSNNEVDGSFNLASQNAPAMFFGDL
jgi:hypothetical protein